MRHAWILLFAGVLLPTVNTSAQGYRVRLDTRYQSVAIRGVSADSVAVSEVVIAPNGGLESPDGFAVQCPNGFSFCSYFRPGQTRRGGPLVTTADVQVWGFGVPGLRLKSNVRVGTDIGDDDVWPGTDPTLQLVHGYAEYARSAFTVQIGRTYSTSRLGFVGFDGSRLELRPTGNPLSVSAYGGWGLARGVALPLSSPALNPLNDAQPRRRQAVGGGTLSLSTPTVRAQIVYEREWDPGSNAILAERAGLETRLVAPFGLTISAGADYDLAAGFTGNAEGRLSYRGLKGKAHFSVGARRYRPHFDLWTIWGAFSPVPYHALFARFDAGPVANFFFRVRTESYEFDETDATTPLVKVENDGWRWSVGSTYQPAVEWTLSADYHREHGPGAASNGFQAAISLDPISEFQLSLHGGRLERPLEFRFNDAVLWNYGVNVGFSATNYLRLTAGLEGYHEARNRPDQAAFDWDQMRVSVGATLVWGSHTAGTNLPPSIMRIPVRRVGS